MVSTKYLIEGLVVLTVLVVVVLIVTGIIPGLYKDVDDYIQKVKTLFGLEEKPEETVKTGEQAYDDILKAYSTCLTEGKKCCNIGNVPFNDKEVYIKLVSGTKGVKLVYGFEDGEEKSEYIKGLNKLYLITDFDFENRRPLYKEVNEIEFKHYEPKTIVGMKWREWLGKELTYQYITADGFDYRLFDERGLPDIYRDGEKISLVTIEDKEKRGGMIGYLYDKCGFMEIEIKGVVPSEILEMRGEQIALLRSLSYTNYNKNPTKYGAYKKYLDACGSGFIQERYTEVGGEKYLIPDCLAYLIGTKVGEVSAGKESEENLKKLDSLIVSSSGKYNLDADLIRSIILIESGGKTNAVSGSGALGVMQLTQHNYNAWKEDQLFYKRDINPFNHREAIDRGAELLNYLSKKYGGDLDKTVAAYNQGEAVVDSAVGKYRDDWWKHIPEEGRGYIDKVKIIMSRVKS